MMALMMPTLLRFGFATELLNVRISDRDPVTHQLVDRNLDRYGHLFRAFVLKRRITRNQVWPKIYILEGVPGEEEPHLRTQRLYSIKKSMREEVMSAIAKNDPSKINSAFIISHFCEEHFKEMMDAYLSKVLVCGKAPKDPQLYLPIEQKAIELYRIFYFGEQPSPLQREIEQAYLSAKQFKHIRAQSQKRITKRDYDLCRWSERDQRILEEKLNWQPADPNLTDINFRSYFSPLAYPSRAAPRMKYEQLEAPWGMLERFKWRWFTEGYYSASSRRFFEWVEQKLFVRVMNHLKSMEFTACLSIPHDYMIEAQLIQIHFWLLIDRLKKINTHGATVLARRLTLSLNMEIAKSARSVNLKKSNQLQASFERMLETNSNILELHFHRSELTKDNPYRGIDALVWSLAFAEKVPRYSEQVYLFGQYLVRNFKHLQQHTYQQLIDGIVQFDPYLVDQRYLNKIQAINPPLPAAEFERQFNSNSTKKDYYYSKIQAEVEEAMPIEKQYVQAAVDTRFTIQEFLQPLRNLRAKYYSLRTMDHYNKMEQKQKENQAQEKKGTWKGQKDSVKQVGEEFASIQSIKNQRRSQKDQH